MEKNILKIIAVVFALIIIIIFLSTCFASTVKYYEDINYDPEKPPSGIGEIAELDGNKRYYKIVSYGGRVLSLSFHDYDGVLRPIQFEEKNASSIEYEYNENGNLIKITKYNPDSKIVKTIKFKPVKKNK